MPLWTDAAIKERWMALPDGARISVAADGNDWLFPNGTVFMKHFHFQGQLVETRLLVRHDDGLWSGYSYEWDADGLDATWIPGGKTKQVLQQYWTYPSSAQCLQCHNSANNFVIGPETLQLNFHMNYVATQRNANQLDTLTHIGLFENAVALDRQLALPAVEGSDSVLNRSRAYLHANCGFCHTSGGPGLGPMDFHYLSPNMQVCDVAATRGDLGISGAGLVVPGSVDLSIVYQRMNRRNAYGMPPLGSLIVDPLGTTLVAQWINGLSGCP